MGYASDWIERAQIPMQYLLLETESRQRQMLPSEKQLDH